MKKRENELKTVCYVLRRTNYGEADRILNLITPMGKISALARGTRRAKSKLAGGVEMFTRSQVMIHLGRGEMGTLTGVRMERHCANIVKDLARMELASMMLRRVNLMAEDIQMGDADGDRVKMAESAGASDAAEGYFSIIDQGLMALDAGEGLAMVEAWFLMNVARVSGDEVNLYRDVTGERLMAERRYAWDAMERAMVMRDDGIYGVEEIKLMRLVVSTKLAVVARVKNVGEKWPEILQLARSVVK